MTTKAASLLLKASTALTSLIIFGWVGASPAFTNPLDGQVTSGSATITSPDLSTVEINQTSMKAIVEWQSFDIAPGETTRFIQPGNDAWTLNRVVGSINPTQIYGTLEANGNIVIVNPDGIHFGAGAQVDVNRIIATTADISDKNFMGGVFQFDQPGNPSTSIVNEGTITIKDFGLASFVAPSVRNAGVIASRLGTIGLASGNTFTIDPYGDGLIKLAVGDEILDDVIDVATGETVTDLVKNEGTLKADGGTVAMTAATARKAVNSVINNTGFIEASSVGMRGGKIILGGQTSATKTASAPTQRVRVSGIIRAAALDPEGIPVPTPAPRGSVEITGEAILAQGATIDASGTNGGGTILIGGDYMGGKGDPAIVAEYNILLENHDVATSSTVVIDKNSTISVNSLTSGNGGKVIIWSDGNADFSGSINARGGGDSGDGGFVEVSGHDQLAFSGFVNVGSSGGKNGNLLLDPTDATIGTVGNWVITPTAIVRALDNGNVFVTTSDGDGNSDLSVAEDVTWSTGNNLTLAAHRNVAVNADITSTGGANVTVRADKNGTGIGTIVFATAANITTSGQVTLMFNPSVNPAGSAVNLTSYASPTEDFSSNLSAGSSISYMLVNTVYDLQNIENNLAGNYAVGRDIDASETISWIDIPAGIYGFTTLGTRDAGPSNTDVFSGSMNGYGHTIDGLTILADKSHSGLFGAIGGSVRNLVMTNMDVRGDSPYPGNFGPSDMGGLAAVTLPGSMVSYVAITNSQIGSTGTAGGLVGSNFGLITNSMFSGTVIGFNGSGGVVGWNFWAGTINQSYSLGQVGSSTSGDWYDILGNYGGGFIPSGSYNGGITANNQGAIINSYSGSNVYGSEAYTGGIYGSDAFNGGLAGAHRNQPETLISSSYSFGSVINTPLSGGLVGSTDNSSVNFNILDSYWNTTTSGRNTSDGGSGLPTVQLQQGLPTGFDPAIWGQDASINNGMPYLLWQTAAIAPIPISGQTVPVIITPRHPIAFDPTAAENAVGYEQSILDASISVRTPPESGNEGTSDVIPVLGANAGPVLWVSDIGSFSAFRQTDFSNINIYKSPDWATFVTEYDKGEPRYAVTCLAVVYAMIEQARGNSDYRVGQDGTYNDITGALDKNGLVREMDIPPSYQLIQSEISNGNPVILQGYSSKLGGNHFMLAVGTSPAGGVMVLDPLSGQTIEISSSDFIAQVPLAGGGYLEYRLQTIRTVNFKKFQET